ncbi:MAG: GtrA family protein [Rhodocyclaceae bacterium]|nr:GtrA family protein [Rhodocyclaceae bacterium]
MDTPAAKLSRDRLPRQFLSFAAMGAVGTGAHYLTLALLVRAGLAATLATAIGAAVGALVNYGLNYRYTFRSWQPHRIAASRFLAITSVGWLLNAGAFHLLHHAFGIALWPAQIATTALVLAWNFAGNRWWTFGGDRHG